MIRNRDSLAVSSDCAGVGSCWFFSSCTSYRMHNCQISTRALTLMFFTFQNKTKSAAVRQAGGSLDLALISCCHKDWMSGWCLMQFAGESPHLAKVEGGLWHVRNPWFQRNPQALRTGTATYRATGRPNANTRLTLIDTFLQYRQMHYQEIRFSWNFIWVVASWFPCVFL